MFRNYLTVAIRNLFRHRLYTLINILGLAVGLGCCIVLFLYIKTELSFDRNHERLAQIHRLLRETRLDDGSVRVSDRTSGALPSALEQAFPEVQRALGVLQLRGWLGCEGRDLGWASICLAGPEIFEVFSLPLAAGDSRTALDKPASVLVTEEMAKRVFGDQNPIGKVLTINNDITRLRHRQLTVTGVLRDLPRTTSLRFGLLMSPPPDFEGMWQGWVTDHTSRDVRTYVLLPSGYDPTQLERKLPDFMARHMGDDVAARNTYHIQPLRRVRLYSSADYGIPSGGDIARVRFLAIISLLILSIACVNFVNLTTARSAHRTREVGVRKAVGAHRLQLARQFLGESLVLVVVSFAVGLWLVVLLLPEFNALVGTALTLDESELVSFGPWLFVLSLMVSLLAGAYPALYLSSLRPFDVLKGKWRAGSGAVTLRKGLVVFQFAASTLLVTGTAVVYTQVDSMSNRDLGFSKEHVLSLWVYNRNAALRPIADAVKREFLQHPGILSATVLLGRITAPYFATVRPEGTPKDVGMHTISGDEDVLSVYGLELAAGRNIARPGEYLLNESAVESLGWANPIGKEMGWIGEDMPRGPVVGVVKDFHFQSLHEPIRPLFISFCPFPQTLTMRLNSENLAATMSFLKERYEERVGQAFGYRFLDTRIGDLYRNEQRTGQTLLVFGGLALFVACLGLFGLAAFAAEQRTREVGIRKTLGATVASIVALLSKELVGLVCLANAIAWPIAWYAADSWLENFAYRIEVGWDLLAVSLVLSLMIVMLTVGYQAIRTAVANPIAALRHE